MHMTLIASAHADALSNSAIIMATVPIRRFRSESANVGIRSANTCIEPQVYDENMHFYESLLAVGAVIGVGAVDVASIGIG